MDEQFSQILQLFDMPGADDESDDEIQSKKVGKDANQSRDLAEKSMAKGDYAEAIEHFKRAVAQGRSDERADFDIGGAFESADLLPQAFYQYKKAKAKANDPEVEIGLSALYRRYGRIQDATEEIREAIKRDPKRPYLHFRLAEILRANGYRSAAADALSQAIALAPDDPFYHYWNADLLLDSRKYAEAAEASRAAVELNPVDEQVMVIAAVSLWGAGKKPEAIRAARLASDLVTTDSRLSLIILRALYLASGQDEEANLLKEKVDQAEKYDHENAITLLRKIDLEHERQPYIP